MTEDTSAVPPVGPPDDPAPDTRRVSERLADDFEAALGVRPGDAPETGEERERRVTQFELFLDLVFVFAFTQVTAMMAHDVSWLGLAHGMLVLTALWWNWVGYVWLATSFDLEEGSLRFAMLGVLATMFVVALAVPHAFGGAALVFALGFLVVRLAHTALYVLHARRNGLHDLERQVLRALGPSGAISPVLVLVGALAHDPWQSWLILLGLAIDYAGPLLAPTDAWKVSAAHFAERFGLIVIVAFGESMIAAGAGAATGHLHLDTTAAALLGVVVVTCLWWTYFDVVEIVATRHLVQSAPAEQNAIARDSYTYLHLPMIAGIILFALGIKTTLHHVHGHLELVAAIALCWGVALYLVAHILFRLRNVGTLNRQRVCIAVALLVLPLVHGRATGLELVAVVAAAMVGLVAYEAIRFAGARQRVRAMR